MAEVNGQATNGTPGDLITCDVLVVGGGFGGISALHRLRRLGYTTKIFEAGTDFGGVWYWNRYPGARVDSEFPFYQLNIPEVYQTWQFTERFPAQKEIKRYADHLDKILGLRKDTYFSAKVNEATWDVEKSRWNVRTEAGHRASCKYLFLATGLLHKRYTPEFPGIGDFKGSIHHSAFWPEGESAKGKKVAVIGGGATSVQIVQELAKEADHLTVFIRRPSHCIPMFNRPITPEEQESWKMFYPRLFEIGRDSRVGFPIEQNQKKLSDASAEEQEALFEYLWSRGGFNFVLGNYSDVALDLKANRVVYDFWRRKIRERLTDPAKQDIMAPEEPTYPIGTRRTPLEADYYECLNQKNVEIVSLPANPFKKFTENGVLLEDGRHLEFDTVALATGFDSFSGSLTSMGLKNKHGVDIKDIWKDGIESYLGMFIHGFPNLFMIYSPQAPTALSNGPTILECQVDCTTEMIHRLETNKAQSMEPLRDAELEWSKLIESISQMTLLHLTDSWWTGGNIPGKRRQLLTYPAGIDSYEKICREKIEAEEGFDIKYPASIEAS